MLDTLLLLNSLTASIVTIKAARAEVAGSSNVVWDKLYNAHKHLDSQVAELLAPPPQEVADGA